MCKEKAFYALVRLSALGSLFCALVWEEAISVVCKRCANEGFACMGKEEVLLYEIDCLYIEILYGRSIEIPIPNSTVAVIPNLLVNFSLRIVFLLIFMYNLNGEA